MKTIPTISAEIIKVSGGGIVVPRNEGGISFCASHEKIFCHRRELSFVSYQVISDLAGLTSLNICVEPQRTIRDRPTVDATSQAGWLFSSSPANEKLLPVAITLLRSLSSIEIECVIMSSTPFVSGLLSRISPRETLICVEILF